MVGLFDWLTEKERNAQLNDAVGFANRLPEPAYPGDNLQAPFGLLAPATATRIVEGDAFRYPVDAEGNELRWIRRPGVAPFYLDPTIDKLRPSMPGFLELGGDMTASPVGMAAASLGAAARAGRVPGLLSAGGAADRPAAPAARPPQGILGPREVSRSAEDAAGAGVVAREPLQQVDGRLGQANHEPVMFKGKDPADWGPQDFYEFGRQYDVPNLGPADAGAWQANLQRVTTNSGREITIPGGEGPYTYYDLMHLKSQGINPNDLPPQLHQSIHDRMVGAVQPGPGGPTDAQITNQMIFGMISPNQPLTPNELALGRAMVKGPEDMARWNSFIPYNYKTGQDAASPAAALQDRQMYSRGISEQLGLHEGPRGGLGASGSANYSDIAEFTQKMADRPDFFRFDPKDPTFEGMTDAERWGTHVSRVFNEVRGLKAKTGSLSTVWQDPQNAAISAIDRHMAAKFRTDMFSNPAERATWERGLVDEYNSAYGLRGSDAVRDIDGVLNAPGGRGIFVDRALQYVNALPTAVTRNKAGEFNPRIPAALQNTDWIGPEPTKMQLLQGPYTRALDANARDALEAGQGLFSNQWMNWDRIRGRLEPHEILYPGLEKLPRFNMDQMRRVRDDLSQAGYMAAEGGVRPLPSPGRAAYWSVLPGAGGIGSLLDRDDAPSRRAQ